MVEKSNFTSIFWTILNGKTTPHFSFLMYLGLCELIGISMLPYSERHPYWWATFTSVQEPGHKNFALEYPLGRRINLGSSLKKSAIPADVESDVSPVNSGLDGPYTLDLYLRTLCTRCHVFNDRDMVHECGAKPRTRVSQSNDAAFVLPTLFGIKYLNAIIGADCLRRSRLNCACTLPTKWQFQRLTLMPDMSSLPTLVAGAGLS